MSLRDPDPRNFGTVGHCDGCARDDRHTYEGPRRQYGDHGETRLCLECWAVLVRYAMAEADRKDGDE